MHITVLYFIFFSLLASSYYSSFFFLPFIKSQMLTISGGSKITADGDCSHEIKRRLLLGRKVTTNLDSILKSRDITLPTKVHLVKAMVFPVVMYGCESWIVSFYMFKSHFSVVHFFWLRCTACRILAF